MDLGVFVVQDAHADVVVDKRGLRLAGAHGAHESQREALEELEFL
jgi:hypothetical protein